LVVNRFFVPFLGGFLDLSGNAPGPIYNCNASIAGVPEPLEEGNHQDRPKHEERSHQQTYDKALRANRS
jgi:hypothetical protein